MVPRPETWRPGRGAPWGALDSAQRQGLGLAKVTEALHRRGMASLPEEPMEIQGREAAVADGPFSGVTSKHSAVLIALFEEEGEARVILTRRADHLRTHRSQVSFPGGRIDEGETPLEAALREAEEEVGLDRGMARPLGHLPSVVTIASGALIQPVVVALERRPVLSANLDEVARVFDISLAELVGEGVFREELWPLGDHIPGGADGVPLWFFEAGEELIWGATGRLLVDLLATVLDLELTRGFRA